MLTMGCSDGSTFMAIDFVLLNNKKAQINGIKEKVDKRIFGYKRRSEALQTAPSQIPDMVHHDLSSGVEASYV